MVSVIVPIYNVNEYLDECIESIIVQSYKNIEIILINDGSIEDCRDICIKYISKDNRVIYVEKQNEGLGPTRNLGIRICKGEYVMFVDSDDYLPKDSIKNLVECIKLNKADMAAGNYNRLTDKEIENRINKIPFDVIDNDEKKSIYLCEGFPEAWAKIYKTDFLIRQGIIMPNLVHEDCAIFPNVVFNANKIALCNKNVYSYRAKRTGSIMQIKKNKGQIHRALRFAIEQIKKLGEYDKYKISLKKYCEKYIFGSILDDYNIEQNIQREYSDYIEFLNQYFPDWNIDNQDISVCCLGSFSLVWMIKKMFIFMDDRDPHYIYQQINSICRNNNYNLKYQGNFSSIVTLFEPKDENITIKNNNAFRQQKVWQDINCGFIEALINYRPDFILIDFLEERYDLLETEKGKLITRSEAFLDSEIEGMCVKRIIKSGTHEFFELWVKKCNMFVDFLKQNFSTKQIILVRNVLSEKYFKNGQFYEYEDKEKIKNINNMLEKMYDYFLSKIDNVTIFDMPQVWRWSDEKVKYGCSPEYYNGLAYTEMGRRMSFLTYR